MSRRVRTMLLSVLVLGPMLLAGTSPRGEPPLRPNILLVLADDLGVDRVTVYGESGQVNHTPVMDAMAASGVLFRNAYASPVCSPTRLGILTGEYPHRYGVGRSIEHTADEPWATPPADGSYDHLPGLLRDAGYRTAAVGKWHMNNAANGGMLHPLLVGYETHRGPRNNVTDYYAWEKWVDGVARGLSTKYLTIDTTDEALDVIASFGDEPWFVYAAYNAPHEPYQFPPEGMSTFAGQGDTAAYKSMVEALDREIGRLLRSLHPAVLRRTVVIVMGDNGTPTSVADPAFTPGKGTIKEGGIHVPLIVFGGDLTRVPRGVERSGLVQQVDLFATILHMAGAEMPARDGVSWLPHLAGTPDSARSMVFAHSAAPNALPCGGSYPYQSDKKAARDGRYKLILKTKTVRDGLQTSEEFYDLQSDPTENIPLNPSTLSNAQQGAHDALLRFVKSLYPCDPAP